MIKGKFYLPIVFCRPAPGGTAFALGIDLAVETFRGQFGVVGILFYKLFACIDRNILEPLVEPKILLRIFTDDIFDNSHQILSHFQVVGIIFALAGQFFEVAFVAVTDSHAPAYNYGCIHFPTEHCRNAADRHRQPKEINKDAAVPDPGILVNKRCQRITVL